MGWFDWTWLVIWIQLSLLCQAAELKLGRFGLLKPKYHGPGGLGNTYLFLTILETGSPRSGCQHGEENVLFLVIDGAIFLYHLKEKRQLCSLCPLIRAPIPL